MLNFWGVSSKALQRKASKFRFWGPENGGKTGEKTTKWDGAETL